MVALLVQAVTLLLTAAAGRRADALSLTVTGTECVHELVPDEGGTVSGNFVVVDHAICWGSDHPGIDLTETSPGGNTVYTVKGKSCEKFEFKAPRGGMYKLCFHNPYGAPETLSFYIHVGRIRNDEHNLTKHGLEKRFEEEVMKKRFEESMTKYHCTYKDEEEKAHRYELFQDFAKIVDKLNFLEGGLTTYQTNHFCDLTVEEKQLYYGELAPRRL